MEKGICWYGGDTYVFDYFRIHTSYLNIAKDTISENGSGTPKRSGKSKKKETPS